MPLGFSWGLMRPRTLSSSALALPNSDDGFDGRFLLPTSWNCLAGLACDTRLPIQTGGPSASHHRPGVAVGPNIQLAINRVRAVVHDPHAKPVARFLIQRKRDAIILDLHRQPAMC